MKKLLFLTAIMLVSTESVFAQAEPRGGNNGRSLQDYYASKYGSPSSSKTPTSKPPIETATGQSQRAISDEQRIIDAVSKHNHFSYDTANTSQRVNAQPSSNEVPKFGGTVGARSYSEMFKTDHRTLPGYDPTKADKPTMAVPNSPLNKMPIQNTAIPKKYSATIGEYVNNKLKGATSEDRSYYDKLMSEQHFNRPHQQGPLAVPQGGYIHVMKDKRARNYFQGK